MVQHSFSESQSNAEYEWRKEGGNLFSLSRRRFVTPVSEPLSGTEPAISHCIGMFILLRVSVPWCRADPQRHTWPGAGGQGGATINRELMSISGGGQTFQFISILIGTVCWIGISLADLWEVWEEKWIIANFLSTVTWQLTLENWEIEPRKSGSLSRARVFPHHPQLWDRRQEMKSIRCRIEESL